MNINTIKEDKTVIISIDGRLDTLTAPELENEIKLQADECEKITLNLSKLEYISSAGLRVLVMAHKLMSEKGGFTVRSANKNVMEILKITNLSSVLNIED